MVTSRSLGGELGIIILTRWSRASASAPRSRLSICRRAIMGWRLRFGGTLKAVTSDSEGRDLGLRPVTLWVQRRFGHLIWNHNSSLVLRHQLEPDQPHRRPAGGPTGQNHRVRTGAADISSSRLKKRRTGNISGPRSCDLCGALFHMASWVTWFPRRPWEDRSGPDSHRDTEPLIGPGTADQLTTFIHPNTKHVQLSSDQTFTSSTSTSQSQCYRFLLQITQTDKV